MMDDMGSRAPSHFVLLKTLATVAVLVIWLAPLDDLMAGTPVLPYIPAGVFYITNYGATGDGMFTNTTAIQAALDAAGAAGGGTVEVAAPGTFLCGPLQCTPIPDSKSIAGRF